jgi:hypothetical protein
MWVAAQQLADDLDAQIVGARVRQKTPFGPARPNAVRTPST